MIQAFVTGNIGNDAEIRQAGNTSVCSFSVASSKKKKGEETTTWVRCSLWGNRGESLAQHLTKGKRVAVTGELSTREHNGKTYVELNVSEIDFMGGGKPAAPGAGDDAPPARSRGAAPPADDDRFANDDGEIPFGLACYSATELWWNT